MPALKATILPLEFPLALLGPVFACVDVAAGHQTYQSAVEHGVVGVGPFGAGCGLAGGDSESGGGVVLGL